MAASSSFLAECLLLCLLFFLSLNSLLAPLCEEALGSVHSALSSPPNVLTTARHQGHGLPGDTGTVHRGYCPRTGTWTCLRTPGPPVSIFLWTQPYKGQSNSQAFKALSVGESLSGSVSVALQALTV